MLKLDNAISEYRFLRRILGPHWQVVSLFLIGSMATSLLDGISIGLLIPILVILQGDGLEEGMPSMLWQLAELMRDLSGQMQLVLAVGVVIMAVLCKNLCLGLTYRLGARLSNRIAADLQASTVDLLLRAGLAFHHQSKLGDLLAKAIHHPSQVRDLVIYAVQGLVFSLILVVLIGLMILISWPLTIVSLLLGGLCVLLMSRYIEGVKPLSRQTARTVQMLTSTAQETLSAVQPIQSYGKEDEHLQMVREKVEENRQAQDRVAVRIYWVQPFTEMLAMVAMGLLLLISTVMVPNVRLPLTELLPFLYILLRVTTALKLLNDAKGIVMARWPYLKLLTELLRRDNKHIYKDGTLPYLGLRESIEFQSVDFAYPNESVFALRNVSMTIPKGSTTAIVGKSGAGKSTIAHLMLRFYDPAAGKILIDGQALTDLQRDSYRRRIAVVSQDTFIFNDTAAFNIAFGTHGHCSQEQLIDAAKKAGAHEFIRQFPNGYETVLGDRGAKLSGGQRQRISIARAILNDPDILILDEATSALDSVTERLIHQAIDELGKNRTVIIIAHRLSTIRGADQIIVLEAGRIVESGRQAELLARKQAYYELAHEYPME